MEISPRSRLDGIVAMTEATFLLCTSMAKLNVDRVPAVYFARAEESVRTHVLEGICIPLVVKHELHI